MLARKVRGNLIGDGHFQPCRAVRGVPARVGGGDQGRQGGPLKVEIGCFPVDDLRRIGRILSPRWAGKTCEENG